MALPDPDDNRDTVLQEPADRLTVAVFTADEVVTIAADSTVADAAAAMAAAELGLLVVGSTDDVEGVISERDVVRAVASRRDLGATPIRELETTKLIWCDSGASVGDVAELMLENYVRHVLVEEDGELVGVVSARDLLGAYATGG